ncbi:MAG: transposase [Janthinobacterium lividum]
MACCRSLLQAVGRGNRRVDDRRVVNGIFYLLRTVSPWSDLPERRTTVYNSLTSSRFLPPV